MRRQKQKRYRCKGGGGGGGTGPRVVSTSTRSRTRKSTNTTDKSTWNSPPNVGVEFYKGKRIKGMVLKDGNVLWTIDGTVEKGGAPGASSKVPVQELKDLKAAWREYLTSPNSKRILHGSIYYDDGVGKSREKIYRSLGFRIERSSSYDGSSDVYLDNR